MLLFLIDHRYCPFLQVLTTISLLKAFRTLTLFFVFPSFFGILTAQLFRVTNSGKFTILYRRIPSFSKVVICFAHLLAICFLTYLAFFDTIFSFTIIVCSAIINQLKSGLLFSIIIYLLACFEGPLFKLLSSKILVFLGKISFCFYLFHQPIMILASQLGGVNIYGFQLLYPSFLVVLIWTLLASFAFHKYIEKPIYHINRSLFAI